MRLPASLGIKKKKTEFSFAGGIKAGENKRCFKGLVQSTECDTALESARPARVLRTLYSPLCMADAGGLFIIDGDTLYDRGDAQGSGGGRIDTALGARRNALYMSGKICVFPDAIECGNAVGGVCSDMKLERSFGAHARIDLCDAQGTKITPYTQMPEQAYEGDTYISPKGILYKYDGMLSRFKEEKIYLRLSGQYIGAGIEAGQYIRIECEDFIDGISGLSHKIVTAKERHLDSA